METAMATTMQTPAPQPYRPHRETVRPEWVDYNGHMNVAYYVLVFDHATDRFLDYLGLGADYRARTERSVFVVEAHVTFDREALEGDGVEVTTRLLDHDAKRLHLFHEMSRADGGELVATNELMLLHVDLETRRATPLPDDAGTRIAAVADARPGHPRPPRAGRSIGLDAGRSGGG